MLCQCAYCAKSPEPFRRRVEPQRQALGEVTAELCEALRWEALGIPGAHISYRDRQATKDEAPLAPLETVPYNADLTKDLKRAAPPGSRANNYRLYAQVAAGNECAIREMIETNTALAITIAERYIKSHPVWEHQRDDVIASALLGLTKAVRTLARPDRKRHSACENTNPVGYLCRAIKGTIIDATAELVGKKIPANKTIDGTFDLPVSTPNPLELREEIEVCAEDWIDRAIIRSFLDGYDPDQIATDLNIDRKEVFSRRRDIYARYQKRKQVHLGRP